MHALTEYTVNAVAVARSTKTIHWPHHRLSFFLIFILLAYELSCNRLRLDR
jgi:hypothetical protein